MSNSKGFIFFEVLVVLTILIFVVSLFTSISIRINQERKLLKDRRTFSTLLHDELQPFIWGGENPSLPKTFHKTYHEQFLTFHFSYEQEMVKGCVTWNHERQKEETLCLFGRPHS